MSRTEMIDAIMGYREDKPRAFWASMDDDMLRMSLMLAKQWAKQRMTDEMATA